MARKIFITSDMSIDVRLMSLGSEKAALMWPWILLSLDDWGRGDASPRRLKAQVFPMLDSLTIEDVSEALSSYSDAGLLLMYEADGKHYMAVPPVKWFRYQTHVRSVKRSSDEGSHFPAPPKCPDSGQKSSDSATTRATARECAQNRASPSPPPTPSPSPSPPPSPQQREVSRNGSSPASPGSVGGGLFEKSVSILVSEGFAEIEIRAAIANLEEHPTSNPVRNPTAVLRKAILRLRTESPVSPAVPPVVKKPYVPPPPLPPGDPMPEDVKAKFRALGLPVPGEERQRPPGRNGSGFERALPGTEESFEEKRQRMKRQAEELGGEK